MQKVDSRGVTLNFGRARRCYRENQRQEIATWYPKCVVDGCPVPIRDCEIHHQPAWEKGGQTDVKTAVPLCRCKHHRQVTEGGHQLEASQAAAWTWSPARRRGTPGSLAPALPRDG